MARLQEQPPLPPFGQCYNYPYSHVIATGIRIWNGDGRLGTSLTAAYRPIAQPLQFSLGDVTESLRY